MFERGEGDLDVMNSMSIEWDRVETLGYRAERDEMGVGI
jgi:hypothetical protein